MSSTRIKHTFTISELAHRLELEFKGEADLEINTVSSFSSATKTDLCFLLSPGYLNKLQASSCGAVLVPLNFTDPVAGKTLVYAANPQLAFVKAIHILQPQIVQSGAKLSKSEAIHASAQLASSVKTGNNVSIGANCVIGEQVILGDEVHIGAGCIIEKGSMIGARTRLLAGVTVCHQVTIGEDVIIHPGVVIGSDGFGLVHDEGQWVKIPHLGSVQIGNEVEIGANTTVDRGALDDTIIQRGVKLDNQIQVAHNVQIGENTAIAACVGIAGSAIIGKNCRISGAVGILGHLSIADNVTITAMSLVTKSIKHSGVYSSGTPMLENRLWRQVNARYKSLDKMAKSISSLQKQSE